MELFECEGVRRMREKFKYAGETVKIKNGVGPGLQVDDMSGMDFTIEDWCVDAREPMPMTDEPLPKMERAEE